MRSRGLAVTLALAVALGARTGPGAAASSERPEALRRLLVAAVNDADGFEDRFDAEVWLLDMVTRLGPLVPEAPERFDILKAVHREATRAGLEPELVLSVITVESRFDRYAISEAGARGLMQVMPFWLEEIGRTGDDLFHVNTNLRFGCTILRYYLDAEKGNLTRALARYNGSLGELWYPGRVFDAYRRRWSP